MQAQLPAPASVDQNSAVARLGRYIRLLATSPRNLDALLGAGQASLDLGDANAALGFFSRAQDAAPSNGRAKAGLGSALVMTERADEALPLFAQAIASGVPEAEVARDRGLAYDLRGDSGRAQRDYALALTQNRDDELVRRYGLSLGISGQRAAALATIDPLLRKQDQGAWRARAFILAMTGDVTGANTVAHQLMVPAVADSMSPLLARLATLNAAQRAHAVNFGTVPADGTQLAAVKAGDPYLRDTRPLSRASASPIPPSSAPVAIARTSTPAGMAGSDLIPKGAPLGPAIAARSTVATVSRSASQSGAQIASGATSSVVTPTLTTSVGIPGANAFPLSQPTAGQRVAQVDRSHLSPQAREEVAPAAIPPDRSLPPLDKAGQLVEVRRPTLVGGGTAVIPVPPIVNPPSVAASSLAMRSPTPSTVADPVVHSSIGSQASAGSSTASASLIGPPEGDRAVSTTKTLAASARAQPMPAPAPIPVITAAPKPAPTTAGRLGGLLDGVEREADTNAELPSARELRLARAAVKKKLADLAAQGAKEKAAKEQVAKDKAVKEQAARDKSAKQAEAAAAAKRFPARLWVQVATGRADSGLTWKRIKAANESALEGLSAWSSPYKSTSRILAGPLKSAAAARDLVKALAKNDVHALTFSSEAGQEVIKIGGK